MNFSLYLFSIKLRSYVFEMILFCGFLIAVHFISRLIWYRLQVVDAYVFQKVQEVTSWSFVFLPFFSHCAHLLLSYQICLKLLRTIKVKSQYNQMASQTDTPRPLLFCSISSEYDKKRRKKCTVDFYFWLLTAAQLLKHSLYVQAVHQIISCPEISQIHWIYTVSLFSLIENEATFGLSTSWFFLYCIFPSCFVVWERSSFRWSEFGY